jgi:hypothetical protein
VAPLIKPPYISVLAIDFSYTSLSLIEQALLDF